MLMPPADCVFCQIIAGSAPATDYRDHGPVVSFTPLGPQVPGHILFVPKRHVADAIENEWLTGQVFRYAARHVADLGRPANIITSVGRAATQSIFHLHVHVLPRGESDGLRASWPWVRAKSEAAVAPSAPPTQPATTQEIPAC